MSALNQEAEVERSVRDLLYGERTLVTAVPRPAGSVGRLAGGRYRLLESIGAGGMGTVYRALDERLKREVAVKLITGRLARGPNAVERFRREAEFGARLAHPNIVAVFDAGSGPRDFIVMELVDGIDVSTLVRRQGPLTAGEAVHLIAQICDALTYAHERSVVHRDVSPGNVLVRLPDLTAKLGDFGVASDVRSAPAERRPDIVGTPGYVAPELVRGAPPSPRSDLYSLGLVAYRLLTVSSAEDPEPTRPPATASPRIPPLAAIRPKLPRELCEAVDQALAREPSERQSSVAEFHAQLVRSRGAEVVTLTPAA